MGSHPDFPVTQFQKISFRTFWNRLREEEKPYLLQMPTRKDSHGRLKMGSLVKLPKGKLSLMNAKLFPRLFHLVFSMSLKSKEKFPLED
jgi:hypothetical protein